METTCSLLLNAMKKTSKQLFKSISKISAGLINETYKIKTDREIFILQKLNPIFKKGVNNNINAVSKHLIKHGLKAQEIIKAKNNWRFMTYIPGKTFDKINDITKAYEAGKILGQFHRTLANFKYKFKHKRLLHHNTKKLFSLFKSAIAKNSLSLKITSLAKIINNLPKLFLPKNLRKNITHGDPKINNVIFQNNKAVALIDLDDCGRKHNVLVELGDAFRSWCGDAEDDPNNKFNLNKFRAALQGYTKESKNFLLEKEKKLLPQAIKLITLELASRFLRDYFEDCYFSWNNKKYPSRKAHNLARAQSQIALYQDIIKKENQINKIIKTTPSA